MQPHPLCFLELTDSDSLEWELSHTLWTDGLSLLFCVQKLNTQSQGVGGVRKGREERVAHFIGQPYFQGFQASKPFLSMLKTVIFELVGFGCKILTIQTLAVLSLIHKSPNQKHWLCFRNRVNLLVYGLHCLFFFPKNCFPSLVHLLVGKLIG